MSGYCVWGGPKPNGKIHLCFLNPSLTPCHNMIIREQCLEKHRFFGNQNGGLQRFSVLNTNIPMKNHKLYLTRCEEM